MVWQETCSQMGLRSARETQQILPMGGGGQGRLERGEGTFLWRLDWLGTPHGIHPKRDPLWKKRWYFCLHRSFLVKSCSFEPVLLEKLVFHHFVQTLPHFIAVFLNSYFSVAVITKFETKGSLENP